MHVTQFEKQARWYHADVSVLQLRDALFMFGGFNYKEVK